MNGLSLFTGIGGIDVALSEWVKPVAYCEIDPYCQSVLLQRMQEGNLSKAPIWDDIRTLCSGNIQPVVDIIYGGFPCQDISITGAGKGLDGERSGLFFEIIRLAKEIKPKFIFIENVPAITSRGGLQVVKEIASLGYGCRWCVISAASIGACHKRERWFFLANSNSKSGARLSGGEKKRQPKLRMQTEFNKWNEWPQNESQLLRVDNVIPNRLDRTKAIGNSVVPIQAKKAFKELIGFL